MKTLQGLVKTPMLLQERVFFRAEWYENLTGLGKKTKALQARFVRAELGKQKGLV